MDYLIAHGIDKRRLTAAGYGKTLPKTLSKSMIEGFDFLQEGVALTEEFIEKLTPEQQEIADQMNRRTEFKVTDTNFGLY